MKNKENLEIKEPTSVEQPVSERYKTVVSSLINVKPGSYKVGGFPNPITNGKPFEIKVAHAKYQNPDEHGKESFYLDVKVVYKDKKVCDKPVVRTAHISKNDMKIQSYASTVFNGRQVDIYNSFTDFYNGWTNEEGLDSALNFLELVANAAKTQESKAKSGFASNLVSTLFGSSFKPTA